jgi:pre-mRNA-splicing factor SYF2
LPGEEIVMDKQKLVDHMAEEIEERVEKRNVFSRRRAFNDEKDITSINERNRRFNEKLERNYGKYASEIKSNLDRGTAL